MALVLNDRVKETSTTTGAGTYNLDGAVADFQSFVAGVGTTNTTWYMAFMAGGGWETGIGTVTDATPDTLARTTILQSSNADAAVNWGAGTKTIVCSLPASKTMVGPDSATDNSIPRFDATTGKLLSAQNGTRDWIIDDNNALIKGHTAPISAANAITVTQQQHGLSAGNTGYLVCTFEAAATGPSIILGKSRGATVNTFTIVNDGDRLGSIRFVAADGTDIESEGARIYAEIDGTPGANDIPTRVMIGTTPDGGSASVERLRIDSGHNVYAYKNAGANPGQVAAEHWVKLTSTNTLTSNTSAQPIFDGGGGPAGGALTLGTGQYFFESMLHVATMSATSGNAAFSLAGAATLTQILFQVMGKDATAGGAVLTTAEAISGLQSAVAAGAAAPNVIATTGTAMTMNVKGTFNVTVAGTVVPSIALQTANAAVVQIGSYFRCWRAGDTGTATIGAWA